MRILGLLLVVLPAALAADKNHAAKQGRNKGNHNFLTWWGESLAAGPFKQTDGKTCSLPLKLDPDTDKIVIEVDQETQGFLEDLKQQSVWMGILYLCFVSLWVVLLVLVICPCGICKTFMAAVQNKEVDVEEQTEEHKKSAKTRLRVFQIMISTLIFFSSVFGLIAVSASNEIFVLLRGNHAVNFITEYDRGFLSSMRIFLGDVLDLIRVLNNLGEMTLGKAFNYRDAAVKRLSNLETWNDAGTRMDRYALCNILNATTDTIYLTDSGLDKICVEHITDMERIIQEKIVKTVSANEKFWKEVLSITGPGNLLPQLLSKIGELFEHIEPIADNMSTGFMTILFSLGPLIIYFIMLFLIYSSVRLKRPRNLAKFIIFWSGFIVVLAGSSLIVHSTAGIILSGGICRWASFGPGEVEPPKKAPYFAPRIARIDRSGLIGQILDTCWNDDLFASDEAGQQPWNLDLQPFGDDIRFKMRELLAIRAELARGVFIETLVTVAVGEINEYIEDGDLYDPIYLKEFFEEGCISLDTCVKLGRKRAWETFYSALESLDKENAYMNEEMFGALNQDFQKSLLKSTLFDSADSLGMGVAKSIWDSFDYVLEHQLKDLNPDITKEEIEAELNEWQEYAQERLADVLAKVPIAEIYEKVASELFNIGDTVGQALEAAVSETKGLKDDLAEGDSIDLELQAECEANFTESRAKAEEFAVSVHQLAQRLRNKAAAWKSDTMDPIVTSMNPFVLAKEHNDNPHPVKKLQEEVAQDRAQAVDVAGRGLAQALLGDSVCTLKKAMGRSWDSFERAFKFVFANVDLQEAPEAAEIGLTALGTWIRANEAIVADGLEQGMEAVYFAKQNLLLDDEAKQNFWTSQEDKGGTYEGIAVRGKELLTSEYEFIMVTLQKWKAANEGSRVVYVNREEHVAQFNILVLEDLIEFFRDEVTKKVLTDNIELAGGALADELIEYGLFQDATKYSEKAAQMKLAIVLQWMKLKEKLVSGQLFDASNIGASVFNVLYKTVIRTARCGHYANRAYVSISESKANGSIMVNLGMRGMLGELCYKLNSTNASFVVSCLGIVCCMLGVMILMMWMMFDPKLTFQTRANEFEELEEIVGGEVIAGRLESAKGVLDSSKGVLERGSAYLEEETKAELDAIKKQKGKKDN